MTRGSDGELAVLSALRTYRETAPLALLPPPVASIEAAGRRRRRRSGMVAVVAVVALLVGVTATATWLRGAGPVQPEDNSVGLAGIELRYSPTWIPPGLHWMRRLASE